MSDADHEALAAVLRRIEGRALVSGCAGPLDDRLHAGWRRTDAPARTAHSVKAPRTETAWSDYDPATGRRPDAFPGLPAAA